MMLAQARGGGLARLRFERIGLSLDRNGKLLVLDRRMQGSQGAGRWSARLDPGLRRDDEGDMDRGFRRDDDGRA
jgi:hypothetical protein